MSTTFRRWLGRFLPAALTTLLLAACGGGDDASPSQSPSAAAPAPAPAPPPASASNVAACYDLAPAQGKTISLVYRSTSLDLNGQPRVTTHPEEQVVGGLVTFEGHTAIETVATFRPANSSPYTYKSYSLQTGPAELTEYGGVSELVTSTVESRSKSVYTPPWVNMLTAVPGETMTVTFTVTTTNTLNGVSQPPATMTLQTTGLFVGFEPVTIPAGTFNACRFEQHHSGPQNPATTRWLLLGHGVELKASTPAFGGSGASVLELTTLLINGVVPQ